jgi:hypothetical protein
VTGLLDLAIAGRVDLGLSPGEHIVRRHIADGTVQTHGVVVSPPLKIEQSSIFAYDFS